MAQAAEITSHPLQFLRLANAVPDLDRVASVYSVLAIVARQSLLLFRGDQQCSSRTLSEVLPIQD